ncbi:hypothetical protein [Microbispora rosea]
MSRDPRVTTRSPGFTSAEALSRLSRSSPCSGTPVTRPTSREPSSRAPIEAPEAVASCTVAVPGPERRIRPTSPSPSNTVMSRVTPASEPVSTVTVPSRPKPMTWADTTR